MAHYTVEGIDHPVWKPLNYSSWAKTTAEINHGKADGGSLGILAGVRHTDQDTVPTVNEMVE